jgi:hypothetical protein
MELLRKFREKSVKIEILKLQNPNVAAVVSSDNPAAVVALVPFTISTYTQTRSCQASCSVW